MEIYSPGIRDNASIHHKVIKRDRVTIANNILDFEAAIERLGSQRAAAESLNIPRSTWRHWRERKMSIDLPAKTVSFFESSEGTDFLHLLMTALLFVMSQLGNSGTRLIGLVINYPSLIDLWVILTALSKNRVFKWKSLLRNMVSKNVRDYLVAGAKLPLKYSFLSIMN